MIRLLRVFACLSAVALLVAPASTAIAGDPGTATPAPLVATYDSLADTILSAKKAEWNLVHSILATTYGHAAGAYAEARATLAAGKPARTELENLADLVSQLGNEGDAAVAAVRKRLLEGGHHHNAAGEKQGLYEEGFVIVTRAAKKMFLDASRNIAKLSRGGDLAALESEWKRVEQQFGELCEGAKR